MTFEVRKPNSDKENILLITLFIQAESSTHKQKHMTIGGVINKLKVLYCTVLKSRSIANHSTVYNKNKKSHNETNNRVKDREERGPSTSEDKTGKTERS